MLKKMTKEVIDSEQALNLIYKDILIEENKLTTGKFSESSLNESFKSFAEIIGKSIKAEVLIMGRIEDDFMVDKGFFVPFEKTTLCLNSIKKVEKIRKNDSLVFDTINNRQIYHKLFHNNSIELNSTINERINLYEECILKSKKIREVFSIGFWAKDQLYGYLIAINKIDSSFSKTDLEILNNVSISLSNYYTAILNEKEIIINEKEISDFDSDEEFLNSTFFEQNLEFIIESTLNYLNDTFDSYLSAYWMLADNGINENDKIVVLRNYNINKNNCNKIKLDPSELRAKINQNNYGDTINSFVGELLCKDYSNNIESSEFVTFIEKESLFNKKWLWSFLPKGHVVYFPIFESNDLGQKKKVRGVITLRPINIEKLEPNFCERLFSFSKKLQILVESAIYKTRFNKIEKLNELSKNIKLNSNPELFYDSLVNSINEIVGSEACSLFVESKERLILKASTCEYFTNPNIKGSVFLKDDYIDNKIPIYVVSNTNYDSFSSYTFMTQKSIHIQNIWIQDQIKIIFMEKTRSDHQSVLISALIDNNGKSIGILRCINKVKTSSERFNHFGSSDLRILEIIATMVSSIIRVKEFGDYLTDTLARIGHESRLPLMGVGTNLSMLKYILRIRKIESHDINKVLTNVFSEMNVILNNIDAIDSVLKKDVYIYNYELVDIFDIIKISIEASIESQRIRPYIKNFPKINVDKLKFIQVFNNLLSNAIRYSYPKSIVKIIAKDEIVIHNYKPCYFIEIINYGIGVPIGDEKKIFEIERFRSKNAIEVFNAGSGIGLKLVKKIILDHGCDIVLSKNSEPTKFTIFFPIELAITNKK